MTTMKPSDKVVVFPFGKPITLGVFLLEGPERREVLLMNHLPLRGEPHSRVTECGLTEPKYTYEEDETEEERKEREADLWWFPTRVCWVSCGKCMDILMNVAGSECFVTTFEEAVRINEERRND